MLLLFLACSQTMKLAITTLLDFPAPHSQHTDFKLLQSRALWAPFHSMEVRKKNDEQIQATRHKS